MLIRDKAKLADVAVDKVIPNEALNGIVYVNVRDYQPFFKLVNDSSEVVSFEQALAVLRLLVQG